MSTQYIRIGGADQALFGADVILLFSTDIALFGSKDRLRATQNGADTGYFTFPKPCSVPSSSGCRQDHEPGGNLRRRAAEIDLGREKKLWRN